MAAMYLMEVHKFSLAKMGIWAAAPWISLMAVVTLCGHYSDKLLRSGMSQNMVKTATGAAGILLCAGALYVSTRTADPMMNVLWLSVSLGSLGLTMSASWSSVISMGGNLRFRIRLDELLGQYRRCTGSDRYCLVCNKLWLAGCFGSNCCNRYLRCYCLVLCKA